MSPNKARALLNWEKFLSRTGHTVERPLAHAPRELNKHFRGESWHRYREAVATMFRDYVCLNGGQ